MSTTTFTRETLAPLRTDIANALEAVEKRWGITLKLGAMSFRPEQFTARMTGSNGARPSDPTQGYRDAFTTAAKLGLLPFTVEDLETVTTVLGKRWIIRGAKLSQGRRGKDWILASRAGGSEKLYRLPVTDVLRGLGRTEQADALAKFNGGD
jgi:hypothetical protein